MATTSSRVKRNTSRSHKNKNHPGVSRSSVTLPPSFLPQFYANMMATDLAAFTPKDRQRIAESIWSLASVRKNKEVLLRLFNPSIDTDGWSVDHTIIEIVTDDMSFLVDSITAALQKRGLAIHLIIHPVLQVLRDGKSHLCTMTADAKTADGYSVVESWMHIQIDHCLDMKLLQSIEQELRGILRDIRSAVEDWPTMRTKLNETILQISGSKRHDGIAKDVEEIKAMLRWLDNNNFIFLGYRDIDLEQRDGHLTRIHVLKDSGLGILRDPEVRMFGGLRDKDVRVTSSLQKYVRQHDLLVLTKTDAISVVHRRVPMDAIFVRRFDAEGNIVGERLFVGLFTSQSYAQNPNAVPFLSRKIDFVLQNSQLRADGHSHRALVHILNNYPRDEIFQITEAELLKNCMGILQLQERARVAMFLRRDPFNRFATCLIYVPRDRYDSSVRLRMHGLLENAFQGKVQDWNVRIDDSVLARIFMTIKLDVNSPHPNTAKLETSLAEICRSWNDGLRDHLVVEYGEATGLALWRRYRDAFPSSYKDAMSAAGAAHDIHHLERGHHDPKAKGLMASLLPIQGSDRFSLTLYVPDRPIALAEVLPQIEDMGLSIDYMGGPYEVRPHDDEPPIFIHEFVGRPFLALSEVTDSTRALFEESFLKIWNGEAENDAFNFLTLGANMTWREVAIMRCFARYLRQLRIPYSHEMMAGALSSHPGIARDIFSLFFARHYPHLKGNREDQCRKIENRLTESLLAVTNLEDDRILRRYINLVQASLRTNYFQMDADGKSKSYFSVKFESRAVEFMPLPKPLYEIFVYSPRAEAVHLRGGKVARGGIRWSDRRDDFRNEILGLMKAQMVKNGVIVPVGSKGGFIVKRPPVEADKVQAEGIACYRLMIQGLLDITDNRVNGKIVPPDQVVRHDEDDPYLVVAADKGTAKFSDIANGISREYAFWLDDAFASGGSAGYDHKGMAITARGAWEAAKRHFREIGKDIQVTDFTCIGVGDMSGDVFGNGMLLSRHICLLGAFDHRHIFCDPNPDAAKSFAERQRLFNLSRSSWKDYDPKKISKGGGVFDRNAKSIRLTPEMKRAYVIEADTLSAADLIQAMLKTDVEMIYFGGIGTYVKASDETHEEVGDRSAESMRVDAGDIRAKVVVEGANLGVTQRARIEYALKGGRINTDAIDNSGGVDTSDHEVNIKILLRRAMGRKALTMEARNKLLHRMTDDVAALVLRDNYLQTQCLSVAEARSVEALPMRMRCITMLEKSGLLNRDVEFLPHSTEVNERQRLGKGLMRPELAVLLAYSKMWLYPKIVVSPVIKDSYFHNDLINYFPAALRKSYATDIEKHQLKHEIIATVITNEIVNRTGPAFVGNLTEQTGADIAAITRAYIVVRDAFDLNNVWSAIEALDNKVPAAVQIQMLLVVQGSLKEAMHKLLPEFDVAQNLSTRITGYRKAIDDLGQWLAATRVGVNRRYHKNESSLIARAIPAHLARKIASMPILGAALDLMQLARKSVVPMNVVAETYFGLDDRLSLHWLSDQGRIIAVQSPAHREAVAMLVDDVSLLHKNLTASILGQSKPTLQSVVENIDKWLKNRDRDNAVAIYDALVQEALNVGAADLAVLTLAAKRLADVVG
jgi:glutamate dehydrogenase